MLKRGRQKVHRGRKRTAHAEILKVKQNKTMLIYSLYLCSWFAVVFMNIILRVAFSWLEDREHGDAHLGNRYGDRSICILYL